MNIFFSFLFLVIIIWFFIENNYYGLLALVILSLLGDMFYFNFFNSRIILFQLISLMFFPIFLRKNFRWLSSLIRGINIEYLLLVLLGILYGFIIPWHDGSGIRTWSQVPSGRSLVALVSIYSEILLIYFSYYVFKFQKISLHKFLSLLSIVVIIVSSVAFFDFFFNYPIYRSIFSLPDLTMETRIFARLIGFSHEPRSFGRLLTMAWVFLAIFKFNGYKYKYSNVSFFLGLLGIIFSLSFSTYFIFILGLFWIYKRDLKRRILSFLTVLIIVFAVGYFISRTDYFKTGIMMRYMMVEKGKENVANYDEPIFFTRFEVFDRAALNFFYFNPKFLLFGTGPNLIAIPSSKYLGKSGSITFHGTINSIPGFGIINLVSRSGLVGLTLYLFAFFKIYRFVRNSSALKDVFVIVFLTYFFVRSPWLYFTIGFVISQQENFNKNLIKNA